MPPPTDIRAEVAAAYERGDDLPTLALRYERTPETIRRWLRESGLLPRPVPRPRERYRGPCETPGCVRPAVAGRRCMTCYMRDYRAARTAPRQRPACAAVSCEAPAKIQGLCRRHYDAKRRAQEV